jgi:hypothetical protein
MLKMGYLAEINGFSRKIILAVFQQSFEFSGNFVDDIITVY